MESDGHSGFGFDGFAIQCMLSVVPEPYGLNRCLGQNPIAAQYVNFLNPAIGCDHNFMATSPADWCRGGRINDTAGGASATCIRLELWPPSSLKKVTRTLP